MIFRLLKFRYVKFCFVGLSGFIVNAVILHLAKNYLFNTIQFKFYHIDLGLNLSMLLAIFISAINNFIFNSLWTWSDRYKLNVYSIEDILQKFLIYLGSSSLGIGIQLIFSNILIILGFHYLSSIFFAVVIASIFNFLFNHFITFKVKSS